MKKVKEILSWILYPHDTFNHYYFFKKKKNEKIATPTLQHIHDKIIGQNVEFLLIITACISRTSQAHEIVQTGDAHGRTDCLFCW